MIYLTKLIENAVVGTVSSKRPVSVGATSAQPKQQEEPQVEKLTIEEKRKLLELTKKLNHYGKSVYREGNVLEVAQSLQEILQLSERYMVSECGDMLEANTLKRNLGEMKKYCDSFTKLANELHTKQKQMESLYEDMSHILERYYSIDEISDAVPTTKSVNKQDAPLKDPRTTDKI